LLAILSLPRSTVDGCRNIAISSIAPLSNLKNFFVHNKRDLNNSNLSSNPEQFSMEKIILENTMLKNQLNGVYEWLFFENRIDDQIDKYKTLSEHAAKDFLLKDFFQRRAEQLKEIIKSEYEAIPAKVIFRDASSWSSSLWVNVGEKNNEELSRQIIAKNSPVVLGQNLVGVVEFVGYKYSRVRLITDAGLIPSVRALRGSSQDNYLVNIIQSLKDHLHYRNNLFDSDEDKENFMNSLLLMMSKLTGGKEEKYLAKGELYGSSEPFCRSKGLSLKGVGFNYDYPDEEGPARDLRTGKIIGESNINIKSEALLEIGDLLVTTGMDGVFPCGLHVAIVKKICDLNNGDYAYEIEATPTATNLNGLEIVMIMPPVGFENQDK